MRKIFYFAFVFIFISSVAFAKSSFHEPSFPEVWKAFLSAQNLDGRSLKKLKKRMKVAALLPALSVGYDHQFREVESLSITDNISISGGNVNVGPPDYNSDFSNNVGQTLRVRAVWKLSETVYHGHELGLERIKLSRFQLRQRALKDLQGLFAKRQMLLKKLKRRFSQKHYDQYLLITETLDVLTGFQFSNQFWRKKS